MIATDAGCEHREGGYLYECAKRPEFSCEAHCTNQPLCLGYAYQASSGNCVLYPKKPTDGSVEICPPSFKAQTGSYAETTNDIVPESLKISGANCYTKISGNNILEFKV